MSAHTPCNKPSHWDEPEPCALCATEIKMAHTPTLTSKCPDCGHLYLSHFTVNHKCPLHAAALELYELLSRIYVEEGAALRPETCTAALELLAKVQTVKARAAIAKAKGESNG
jgi:hypothetical protein